jgi:hypothetical protein
MPPHSDTAAAANPAIDLTDEVKRIWGEVSDLHDFSNARSIKPAQPGTRLDLLE